MTRHELMEKYINNRKQIVNPDGFDDWSDIGFDTPPLGYASVDHYLVTEGEFDESQQTELRLIDEFLNDLALLEV